MYYFIKVAAFRNWMPNLWKEDLLKKYRVLITRLPG